MTCFQGELCKEIKVEDSTWTIGKKGKTKGGYRRERSNIERDR